MMGKHTARLKTIAAADQTAGHDVIGQLVYKEQIIYLFALCTVSPFAGRA